MSEIEVVITWSRRLEQVLISRYGATGRGLHSLTTSAARVLPEGAERALRWVATVRNRVVHDDSFRLRNPRGFARKARRLERELVRGALRPRSRWWRGAVVLALLGAWLLARLAA